MNLRISSNSHANHQFSYFSVVPLTLLFFIVWLASRYPALHEQVLVMDDFLIGIDDGKYHSDQFEIPDRRIVTGLWFYFAANFPAAFLSDVVKVIAGLGMSAFCALFARTLNGWGVSSVNALLIGLLIITNPLINDITLWNTVGPLPIYLCLNIIAFSWVINSSSISSFVWALVFVLIACSGYEYYFSVFLCLVVAELLVRVGIQQSVFKGAFRVVCFIALVMALFVLQALLIESSKGRGVVDFAQFDWSFIALKLKAFTNLYVNLHAPTLAYFLSPSLAFQYWEYFTLVPLLLFLVFGILRRDSYTFIRLVIMAALLLCPLLPVFIMNQSPESWRTAIPSLLAYSLLISAVFLQLERVNLNAITGSRATTKVALIGLQCCALMIVFLQSIAARSDAESRVLAAKLDSELIEELRTHDHSVAYILFPQPRNTQVVRGPLTEAYHTKPLESAFRHEFSWRGKLVWENLPIDGDAITIDLCNSSLCSEYEIVELRAFCDSNPQFIQPETQRRIVHFTDKGVSLLCEPTES